MVSVQLDGLEDELRRVVRDELARAMGQAESSGYMSVKSAAAYLDMTEPALRALIKRGEVAVHRAPNGRLSFDRASLDAWARSEYVEGQAA